MPLRNLLWLLTIPALVGLGLAIGYSAPAPDRDYRLIRQIVEVLAEVDKHYVRELSDDDRQKLVENMINGGLADLDKHSQYFNEQQLRDFDTENEGSFGGVGILFHVDAETKFPKVEYPMAGTPAYDAGVVAGDLIVKVESTSTENMKSDEVRKLITGETGTPVKLALRRGGKDLEVTLTRARIALHPVSGVKRRTDDPTRWNWFIDEPNKIALIRIAQFNELAAREVKAALEEIQAAGGRALVIDLRDNPGGLLTQAIKVSELFLTEGKIVTTKDRDGGNNTHSAHESGTMFLPAAQKPIVVIVNEHSASASEIVAAALQDNKRAVVVGERTYGKGSVQTLFRLPPNEKTAVKLTTQTWWRPNGKNMDKAAAPPERPDEWGVDPDPELAVKCTQLEKLRYSVEMQKLRYVAGKPEVVGPNPPPAPPINPKDRDGKPLLDESKPFDDRMMDRALEYLHGKLPKLGAVPQWNALPQPTRS